MNVALGIFLGWGVVALIGHVVWRVVAREELREIGVEVPGFVRSDLMRTLTGVYDNRSRLPGWESLFRTGLAFTIALGLWIAGWFVVAFVVWLARRQ